METAKDIASAYRRLIMPRSGNGIDFFKAEAINPSLMAQIRRYDPDLIVYHDSNVARWGVARMTRRGITFLFLWQTDPGGGYLPLDNRLLAQLAKWDLWRSGAKNANEEASRRDDADTARADKAEKDLNDDLDHLSRANRRQITKAIEAIL